MKPTILTIKLVKSEGDSKMMSEKLIRIIAEESNDMALWASIIHWWELKQMPCEAVKELDRPNRWYWMHTCGLCIRRNVTDGDCINCPLAKADLICGDDSSVYLKARDAVRHGDNSAWQKHSNQLFAILCSIAGVEVFDKMPEQKKEPEEVMCKLGDRFSGPHGEYILTYNGCAGKSWKEVLMVNLRNGGVWSRPRTMPSSSGRMKLSDIHAIIGDTFMPIEESNKT